VQESGGVRATDCDIERQRTMSGVWRTLTQGKKAADSPSHAKGDLLDLRLFSQVCGQTDVVMPY
jgi:hypothetical protein